MDDNVQQQLQRTQGTAAPRLNKQMTIISTSDSVARPSVKDLPALMPIPIYRAYVALQIVSVRDTCPHQKECRVQHQRCDDSCQGAVWNRFGVICQVFRSIRPGENSSETWIEYAYESNAFNMRVSRGSSTLVGRRALC